MAIWERMFQEEGRAIAKALRLNHVDVAEQLNGGPLVGAQKWGQGVDGGKWCLHGNYHF